jgi:hypothetical protein
VLSSQLTHGQTAKGIKPITKKPTGEYSTHPRYTPGPKRQTVQLAPIPGSPNATDNSNPPSIASKRSLIFDREDTNGKLKVPRDPETPPRSTKNGPPYNSDSLPRPRTKSASTRSQPMSLHAALQEMSGTRSENGHVSISRSTEDSLHSINSSNDHSSILGTPVTDTPPTRSPSRPIPAPPKNPPTVAGKGISSPIPNHGKILMSDRRRVLAD